MPTVAIFGSTNPMTTSPPGEKTILVRKPASCSPCLKKICPTDFRCMTMITVDDVVAAAHTLLEKLTRHEREDGHISGSRRNHQRRSRLSGQRG
ncbi:MAG: hypothetical protein EHM66_04895 [Deltaproteobacteria bacterium]|nr:MAG: hypothetical protein EHM66_04895 [Deltaproteobacteria bacterium]